MRVQVIVFNEDAIFIEYTEEPQNVEFPSSSQISIPYRVAAKHAELSNEIGELFQNVESLLDSALLASKGVQPLRQMGVE